MQAVYNFRWDSSYSPAGISYYMLNVNGNTYSVYGNNIEIGIEENSSVHAEVVAYDYAGQVSDPAVMDFIVPDYVEEPVRPSVPGNFYADFIRWQ